MPPDRSLAPLGVTLGLTVLLCMIVFYGCRVFEPEPLLWNELPETILSGAPAETTGTRFLRHLFWYGTDHDGQVVRFIYAITDSTVQDPSTVDEDEENTRFDPSDDVRTLEATSWREIGYTTSTDSTFLFTVDRGSTPSKDITFHIVAVDDKGGIDRTPARLHFFNNSLGNPVLEFTLFSWESELDGTRHWVKRWVGEGSGPNLAESPELTRYPVIGFGRRFRLDWVASSPNGRIEGYRYQIDQSANAPYRPPTVGGMQKEWDPTFRSFEASNEVRPEDIPGCEVDRVGGQFLPESVCPADSVRWPSDKYRLRVEAIDVARVESRPVDGELEFLVNYAPETRLRRDAEWPAYSAPSATEPGRQALSPGDTIPLGSYVSFDMEGNDKSFDRVAPASYGELCCDLIQQDSTVSFQASYDYAADRERFVTVRSTQRSLPFRAAPGSDEPDSIGFPVGPFHYDVAFVARDEHGRVDDSPEKFSFTAGFLPRIFSTLPAEGDSLVLWGAVESPWPTSLAAGRTQSSRWWTGNEWVDDPGRCRDPALCTETSGFLFQLRAEFRGGPHPRESGVSIRAWQFQNIAANDPNNLVQDGLESKNLTDWIATASTPNVWIWPANDALKIFVPVELWFQSWKYEPCGPLPGECVAQFVQQRRQGKFLTRQLGTQRLTVRARNTRDGDVWPVYLGVRVDPQTRESIPIGSAGRRTHPVRVEWSAWVGIDSDFDGKIDRFWPDFDAGGYD